LFLAALLCAASAGAATLEQDEAKIDALIRAEHAARQGVAPVPPAENPRVAAPVMASVIAPAPVRPAGQEWLSSPTGDAGLSFSDLAQNIGKIVIITTAGERVHRGVVKSADGRQVTLQVKRAGGNATYALRREQVLHIDLR